MNSVDERIVDMQFNNKQFEEGVQTSIKSLDALKKGLNLEESAKSLSNLDRVGKSFSLASIAEGVESIRSKFSALGIIGITTLQNITNSVIGLGKQMISSLTVDPIRTGLEEYETKINAIQTILTNTSSKGTKLADVNQALAELNKYADLTIYDFAEMTRNIGTFTAAGVDLKTSVTSIKGIANLAAGSGSSALQASTAMYQLSQAIASGSVKLMDWNSVVNAGMGGELFQNALKKTAKEMGINVDKSKSFRESLESGWLTTKVLTKTLEKFANDKSLIQAATQVKTFTQLFDTMKESVQSGWAVSWENIIGNKDEAAKTLTALNDAFSNLVGPASDARNAMLQFWHDNGGRDALIQAITNAFNGLQSIIKPIRGAFDEIFPPMTGKRLTEITKNLRDLTANFKIGDTTSKNLKDTFKGLFAILDIGKQGISALLKSFGLFTSGMPQVGDGILSFTGNIGRMLVSFDEAIKKSDAFNVAIEKIRDFLKPVSDGIKTAVEEIAKTFNSMTKVDMSGLDSFSERVKARFEPFSKLGDLVKSAFDKIVKVVAKVAPVLIKLGTIVSKVFGAIQDRICKALDNFDFDPVFDLINGGLFAAILVGIKKFISSVTEITDGGKGMLGGIKDILDGVRGCLEEYQKNIKANTLLKIAGALGILTASLLVLSLIDSEKLTSSLAAMSVLFVELFGSMGVMEKVMGSDSFKNSGKMATAMIGISVAVLILSEAMTKLAKLDWEGIAKGLVAVAALSATLVASAKLLSSNTGAMIKGATGFVIFSAALLVLTDAVKKLGALDLASLTKGLVGVGVLMAELVLFTKTSNLDQMSLGKGLGILTLAAAITVLADAVKKFADMDTGAMIQGLAGVAVVLAEVAIFVNVTGDAKRVTSTAVGLTILGAAMLIFAQAISNMGNMSWEQLAKGLITMAGALTIVTVAMNLMPKDMILTGTGLVIVASALVIMADALKSMGGMSWEQIAKGLVTLAASMTIIAIATNFMTTALPGAAALLVVAGALAILTPVLKTLGSMTWEEIGKGLLTLAGAFAVIGVAGLLLAPVTPVLLALGGAIALLGIGCAAVGVGLLAFSAGLAALAVSGTAGAAALVLIVTSLLSLIPLALAKLGEGIITFAEVIGDGAPAILDALVKVLNALIDAIIEIIPKAVDAFFLLLTTILETIADYTPDMVDAGMEILTGFLQGIADHIQDVTEAAIDIIINFIKGIANEIPKVIQAGVDLILSFINGLANAIRNNTPKMVSAIQNLMSAIIQAGLAVLIGSVSGYLDAGSQIMHSGFVVGIQNKISEGVDAVKNLVSNCIDGITNMTDGFRSAGKNIIDGFINGIKSKISEVADWGADLGKAALNAAKKALKIHSPSKAFEDVGMYSVEGFTGGLQKFAGLVAQAATDVGTTAKESLTNAVSKLSNIINGNIDMSPTIRPVLDLSDIESGNKRLSGMFGTESIDVTSARNRVASITQSNQNGSGTTDTINPTKGSSFTFNQNNYSPKPLSRLEIFRQTRNQFSAVKGLVENL
jgi:tape measure domain-containing protein